MYEIYLTADTAHERLTLADEVSTLQQVRDMNGRDFNMGLRTAKATLRLLDRMSLCAIIVDEDKRTIVGRC